jgi:hypothetical protein
LYREWLTPLQLATLEQFFAAEVGEQFFLTGDTALAAFHLHHRHSADLDLFTLDDLALHEAGRLLPRLAADLNCRVGQARTMEHFRRFLLEPENGPALQVDLIRDFGPQYGQRSTVDGIVVDSLENIGANKLITILSRTEARDFVDLCFVLRAGCAFEDLLEEAQEKDVGLHPFFVAGALLQIRHVNALPTTTPPLTLEELYVFISSLADDLLDRLRPTDPTAR